MSEPWSIKYRPTSLDRYVGHDAARAAVQGWIARKSVPYVVLISGGTGSGKTTLAYIIANILSGWEKEPDKNPDLIEVNVGDKRTIDDIRSMIAQAKYRPSGGKRRIMLLDEAHALLAQSTSALLKALEKPHATTTWILATDQPHRLPQTVIGRAKSIHLHEPTEADVIKLFRRVAKLEKVDFGKNPDSVFEMVARAARGQFRLGLQMLESVADQIAGGGRPADAVKDVMRSNPVAQNFDAAIAFVDAMLSPGGSEAAVKAIASVENPDGILDLVVSMVEALIRKKVGKNPTNGVGWGSVRRISANPKLRDLLELEMRLVSAVSTKNTYAVSQAAILYALARTTHGGNRE